MAGAAKDTILLPTIAILSASIDFLLTDEVRQLFLSGRDFLQKRRKDGFYRRLTIRRAPSFFLGTKPSREPYSGRMGDYHSRE